MGLCCQYALGTVGRRPFPHMQRSVDLGCSSNAGPINSHMLVLRSLAMMQAISPDYLSRMISYVDTHG
jgi:hypothetical protein